MSASEGFSADWLALREPADRRARSAALAGRLAAHLATRSTRRRPLTVLDLGAGTGANMRVLAPLLGAGQHWRLVDHDPGLLARAVPPAGVTVERCARDLADDLAPLFEPAPDLVTASALLDLCGQAWIERLVTHAARAGAALLAVLSVDGRQEWAPADPLDGAVLAAFAADQRRDKGLGPALGPAAPATLAASLAAAGYRVHRARSDWRLAATAEAALIAALAEGTACAAAPVAGAEAAAEWAARRRRALRVVIGHEDVLGLPGPA